MFNIVYVNTAYQLEVFMDISSQECVRDYVIVAPNKLKDFFYNYGLDASRIHFINDSIKRESFFQARRRLREVDRFCKMHKGKFIRFWLANDDQPVAQIIFKKLDINEVNLFEEGLGSYMHHKFMHKNMGVKSILSLVKKILFYYPYYTAMYSFGANFKATNCFSYHLDCFPNQPTAQKKLLSKKVPEKVCGSSPGEGVIFLGQPLVEQGMAKLEDYKNLLAKIKIILDLSSPIIYKPHPLESLASLESKLPEGFLVLNELKGAESVIKKLKIKDVIGFYSTALANALLIDNVARVIAVNSPAIKVQGEVYSILERFGCEVVYVED